MPINEARQVGWATACVLSAESSIRDKLLDQLVHDGKALWGPVIETKDGNHQFVAQVTVNTHAVGVALTQMTMNLARKERSRS